MQNIKIMNPLVSIIIPTYNRERYICQAIESAINQTYSNIEIIIGDNQSTDNTWNIINDYASKDSRIYPFQNAVNLGPVLNWQNCFLKAKGKFLKIIWSDDYISHDYIEKALSVFDDETAFVMSDIITIDEFSNETSIARKFRKKQYTTKQYLDDVFLWRREGFPVSPGAAIFKTRDVLKCFVIDIPNKNGLNSKINGAGNDQLLFLNIASLYSYVKIVPDAISFFRSHPMSFSYNDISLYYNWGKIYYLKRYRNKIYSDILKYQLWIFSLKNKNYKKIYRSVKYSTMVFISFFVLIRCYMIKYLKICKYL
jgi:glycosyltransferase involved in cell wall biosynthesis